jgi:hypothetical protein
MPIANLEENTDVNSVIPTYAVDAESRVVGVAEAEITMEEVKELSRLLWLAIENDSRLEIESFRRINNLFLKTLPRGSIIGEENYWVVRYITIPGSKGAEPWVRASLVPRSESRSYLRSQLVSVSFCFYEEPPRIYSSFELFGYTALSGETGYNIYLGNLEVQINARDPKFEDLKRLKVILENIPLRLLEEL